MIVLKNKVLLVAYKTKTEIFIILLPKKRNLHKQSLFNQKLDFFMNINKVQYINPSLNTITSQIILSIFWDIFSKNKVWKTSS